MILGLRTDLTLLALSAACLFGSGCPADDGDDAASTTAPDPSTGPEPQTSSGPDPQTSSGPEPATTTGEPEPTEGATDSTGGAPLDCEDATTPDECTAASTRYQDCAWYDTVLLDDPATCTPGGNAGTCMLATQTDGCTGAEAGCMDTIATVLVRMTDAGFELVLDGPECLDGVGDFTLCDYELLQETSELAEACTCACTLAS